MQHIHISQTDSTNSHIRKLIIEGKIENLGMLTADFQTAGRGQVGNVWESASGQNLLASIALMPKHLDVRQQYYLSMAISSAMVRALSPIVSTVRMKWPNDIYVGDKKLGGILIENTLNGLLIQNSIIGIGLNVNQTKFTQGAPNPISIKNITGNNQSVSAIAQSIQAEIATALQLVDAELFDYIHAQYMNVLYRYDGQYYPYADVKGSFSARIIGVEPDGHLLLLDTTGQTRRYTFKEVEIKF